MSVDECIDAVQKLQRYKGKKAANGFVVESIIIGPKDATKIEGFVKAHFTPRYKELLPLFNSVNEFEPWVVDNNAPTELPQKFTDAFPNAKQ